MPTAVLLLEHYHREIDLTAARQDTARLRQTTADLANTWDGLRPDIVARGGTGQAAPRDSLVRPVEGASTVGAYTRAAPPVLEGADELEKIYIHQ